MEYSVFVEILNRNIFDGDKVSLIKSIAMRPERFVGLFRPTKPTTKVLQYLLQSHEIRFGDAVEELVRAMLEDYGFELLPDSIKSSEGEDLSIDLYFQGYGKVFYGEQKVRDDHDSTKKRGQISNFESKLEVLQAVHGESLIGFMFFVDPDLRKNKNYYIPELQRMSSFYNVKVSLLYGPELFNFIGYPQGWVDLTNWLTQWREDLPDFPEINYDANPELSFSEIKDIPIRYWRGILENDQLWNEGIMKALFHTGDTLQLLIKYFLNRNNSGYISAGRLLTARYSQLIER